MIEYQRIPDLLILPDIAVASKKEVKSVLFVSKVPLTEVRQVAVDTSSRTSVALLKILLYKKVREGFTVGITISSDEKYYFISTSDHNTSEKYYFEVEEAKPKPKLIKERKKESYTR